jgi:hypothetical protein
MKRSTQQFLRTTFPLMTLLAGVTWMTPGCNSGVEGRVVETEGHAYQAIGVARDEGDARIAALDQANSFCRAKKQKPVFRSRELHEGTHKKSFELNLKNLPLIGKVFSTEDKVQILMSFRCVN